MEALTDFNWEELKKLHPVLDRSKFPEEAICYHSSKGNGMWPIDQENEYFEEGSTILQCPYCNKAKRIDDRTTRN